MEHGYAAVQAFRDHGGVGALERRAGRHRRLPARTAKAGGSWPRVRSGPAPPRRGPNRATRRIRGRSRRAAVACAPGPCPPSRAHPRSPAPAHSPAPRSSRHARALPRPSSDVTCRPSHAAADPTRAQAQSGGLENGRLGRVARPRGGVGQAAVAHEDQGRGRGHLAVEAQHQSGEDLGWRLDEHHDACAVERGVARDRRSPGARLRPRRSAAVRTRGGSVAPARPPPSGRPAAACSGAAGVFMREWYRVLALVFGYSIQL